MGFMKITREAKEMMRKIHRQRVIEKCGQERWDQYSPIEQRRILIRSENYHPPPPYPKVPATLCSECQQPVQLAWYKIRSKIYCIACYQKGEKL
jgi:hypothetical protein